VAVLSYHSLEDRRVKNLFKHGNFKGMPVRDMYGNTLSPWKPLQRKPVRPGMQEIKANSRSRSARLRVGEKQAVDWDHFELQLSEEQTLDPERRKISDRPKSRRR